MAHRFLIKEIALQAGVGVAGVGVATVDRVLNERSDMRSACQHVMHFHKLLPAAAISPSSAVVVVTPENIPEHIASRFR
jgi:hypothetical protein